MFINWKNLQFLRITYINTLPFPATEHVYWGEEITAYLAARISPTSKRRYKLCLHVLNIIFTLQNIDIVTNRTYFFHWTQLFQNTADAPGQLDGRGYVNKVSQGHFKPQKIQSAMTRIRFFLIVIPYDYHCNIVHIISELPQCRGITPKKVFLKYIEFIDPFVYLDLHRNMDLVRNFEIFENLIPHWMSFVILFTLSQALYVYHAPIIFHCIKEPLFTYSSLIGK